MVRVIHPAKKLKGIVDVPPDKSITHRSIIFSALSEGTSTIRNPLEGEDCLSTLSCLQSLGCEIEKGTGYWKVKGQGLWGFRPPERALDCGNSGTTMRLLAGILAAQDFSSDLKGDPPLSKRPMDRVAEPLTAMGAQFTLTNGKFPPMTIRGRKPLKSMIWKSKISSAQVKSAVLLAALHAEGDTEFSEPSLSRDHTERMLASCGVKIQRKGLAVCVKGPSRLSAKDWDIPADFSSAAFFIVAGLLSEGSDVVLKTVNLNQTRTGLLTLVDQMGGKIKLQNESDKGGEPVGDICVQGRAELKAATLDPRLIPGLIDEIPIIAVLATQARGTTVLSGLSELRIKETDRLKAMAVNLSRLGAKIRETPDGLIIEGPTPLVGGEVDSFSDHRIAMAMAVAGLISKNPVTVQGSECVAISFPQFWKILDGLVGK